ncbi:hypothetical protein CDAR_618311 [Caerostris darwini]|uniref:Uncharacterized protein n=1 Tax=Caerostris darwini TaxID=1538125 RepID=A0AAV4SV72_9ARAC|nr:hypothetical protein CDAR_618311 [Caerostris darwini]
MGLLALWAHLVSWYEWPLFLADVAPTLSRGGFRATRSVSESQLISGRSLFWRVTRSINMGLLALWAHLVSWYELAIVPGRRGANSITRRLQVS